MLFKRGYINKIKKRNDITLNININNNFKKNFNLKNRKEIILKKKSYLLDLANQASSLGPFC